MIRTNNNMIYRTVTIIAACVLLFNCHQAAAQQFAVKTNALYFVAGSPNLGFEVVTGEHTSVELSFVGHYKPYGLRSVLLACQPEFRYWFSGRPLTREFIGVTAAAVKYNTDFRQLRYDGYSLVAGITGGYAFNLGKRWNVELSAGIGIAGFAHDRRGLNDNTGELQGGDRFNSWGYKIIPVKLGVCFSYIIM